jgi:hypothetical protein
MDRTIFVVSRDHPDLYAYLQERFSTDGAVDIILDRRYANRRQAGGAHGVERRRIDRRQRPEVEAELRSRSHAILTLPDLIEN